MVVSHREIWCSNWRPGDFMKNLETPGKTGRVGRYAYNLQSNFLILWAFFFSGRNSTCYVRDWVGYIVSLCLILFGIVSITVINVYQEKIKDEVYDI